MNEQGTLHVALVASSEELQELYTFYIESYLNSNVTSFSNTFDLEVSPMKFDFIVSDLPDQLGYNPLQIKKIIGLHPKTPFLFISGNQKADESHLKGENISYLEKPFQQQDFMSSVSRNFSLKDRQSSGYVPVRLKLLEKMKYVSIPLHLRLGDNKYIKISHAHSSIGEDVFRKYSDRGIDSFYISEPQAQKFISDYAKRIFSSEAWDRASSAAEAISLNTEVMTDFAASMGWDSTITNLAEKNAKKALYLAKRTRNLEKAFKAFQKIEKFGHADRCTLTLLVASALAHELKISKLDLLHRMTFASLFHDVSLSELMLTQQAKLIEQAKNGKSALSNDLADFTSHPRKSADICSAWSFCPEGVERIILNHHEQPDGKGFPLSKSANDLDNESSLFIVAHDLALYFITHKGQFNVSHFIKAKSSVYNGKFFEKILEALAKHN